MTSSKMFATTKVVQSYVTLLSGYQKNTPHTNHCIVKMLHRIAWDCRMYGLLFQASAFRIFQNIMHDPQRREAGSVKELAKFAKFIVEKFFECAQKNKKVFMEMLFWKNSREVYEIQEGYGSFDKKQSARVLWTEEQEDELQRLYEQYKDVREGDKDVADLIVDNLIDDTKTRRQVIRHLKYLGLIKDLKELRHKPTRTRVLIDWREEEEAELRQWYNQFRDATDVLSRIVENLTIKRPRHRVVEKMLQMGLVNDRKQLRKKQVRKTADEKQRKSKPRSKTKANDSDNDEEEVEGEFFQDEMESESEIESQDVFDTCETIDSSKFKDLLQKVLESGLEPGLQWLKLSLESAIEDREDEDENDDEPEAVPLVPLTEDHHQALTNQDFCKLMKTMGICSPANEQETFWRIPVNLSVRMLRTRVNVLNKAISGDFTSAETSNSTKKLNPRYQMLSNLAKSKQASGEVHDDNVLGLQDKPNPKKNSIKEISSDRRSELKRSKRSLEESSDEESTGSESVEPFAESDRLTSGKSSFNDSRANESNLRSSLQERPSKKRRIVRLEEESDDDVPLLHISQVQREAEEELMTTGDSLHLEDTQPPHGDKENWNSRELIHASTMSVLNSDSHEDSDSDIEKNVSHRKLKKHVIESDDDDE
ncbi:protein timeless homolog [Limulus polyphemus]|uniref:Protein timeless homolog n=1 Tax=Limulus polyphemus TaxID=6850 RepID=A0ABM1SIT3_LIMPO|nr:protein timeless homolog [Limulus polyphemus]